MLHGGDDAPDIDVKKPAVVLFGDVGQRAEDVRAGVVEREIEPSIQRDCLMNQRLDVFLPRRVSLDEPAGAARRLDGALDGGSLRSPAACEHHAASGSGERVNRRLSDAAGPANDQGDLLRECLIGRHGNTPKATRGGAASRQTRSRARTASRSEMLRPRVRLKKPSSDPSRARIASNMRSR